jgi:hypothetical protein
MKTEDIIIVPDSGLEILFNLNDEAMSLFFIEHLCAGNEHTI